MRKSYSPNDLVIHPHCLEWGPGRVLSIDDEGRVKVHFVNAGFKTMNFASLDFDLQPWRRQEETGEERHKRFMETTGLAYKGVTKASAHNMRVTHCWFCKSHLDNTIDLECSACGWIICSCGACGCNYSKRHG